MTDAITAGTILIKEGTPMPGTLLLQQDSHASGWAALTNVRSSYDQEIRDAGWTFFYMAGEIRARAFGFDPRKTSDAALKQLIANVKAQNCNGIEITEVTNKSFLNFPYVSVCAHARHLQKSATFSGSSSLSSPLPSHR